MQVRELYSLAKSDSLQISMIDQHTGPSLRYAHERRRRGWICFFMMLSTDFTNEPAGNARARQLLADHAFSPRQPAALMIARAAAGCCRLPP